MAKPTKNALIITIVVGVIAAIGVLLGFVFNNPIITLLLLFPLLGYEAYRVEGDTTRWAAYGLLVVAIAEILLIAFNVTYDLAKFLQLDQKSLAGYEIPLGDVKLLPPALMAVMSIVLFQNTAGKYTKLLSVLIFLAAFAVIYMLDHTIFERFVRALIDALNL